MNFFLHSMWQEVKGESNKKNAIYSGPVHHFDNMGKWRAPYLRKDMIFSSIFSKTSIFPRPSPCVSRKMIKLPKFIFKNPTIPSRVLLFCERNQTSRERRTANLMEQATIWSTFVPALAMLFLLLGYIMNS